MNKKYWQMMLLTNKVNITIFHSQFSWHGLQWKLQLCHWTSAAHSTRILGLLKQIYPYISKLVNQKTCSKILWLYAEQFLENVLMLCNKAHSLWHFINNQWQRPKVFRIELVLGQNKCILFEELEVSRWQHSKIGSRDIRKYGRQLKVFPLKNIW